VNFAAALEGRTVTRVARRAKYLLFELDDGAVAMVHLGMSGRMVIDPEPGDDPAAPRGKHEHVTFLCGNGTAIRFSDARRFGMMDLARKETLADHRLLRALGPEPLDAAFDGPLLAGRLKGKRTPIKAALLDQRVVAGLGNIYVCEALFAARLSPRRGAHNVQGGRAARLAAAIHRVLEAAIASGGSTFRDHVAPSGEIGYFQHSWRVYGREGEPCAGSAGGKSARVSSSATANAWRWTSRARPAGWWCSSRWRRNRGIMKHDRTGPLPHPAAPRQYPSGWPGGGAGRCRFRVKRNII